MNNKKLKPCPFCESEKVTLFYDERRNYHVDCAGCGKTISFHIPIPKNSSWDEAVEIWNTRTSQTNERICPLRLGKAVSLGGTYSFDDFKCVKSCQAYDLEKGICKTLDRPSVNEISQLLQDNGFFLSSEFLRGAGK